MNIKSLSNQEYIELLEKLVEDQYDEAVDDYDIAQMEWIPAESEIQKKVKPSNIIESIDLTKTSSSDLTTKIKPEIAKYNAIRVGKFKIRLVGFHGIRRTEDSSLCIDLDIKESRTHTPNGVKCGPGGVDYAINMYKDSRFKDKSWMKYCKGEGYFRAVPVDELMEIIRWLQVVQKLAAFL